MPKIKVVLFAVVICLMALPVLAQEPEQMEYSDELVAFSYSESLATEVVMTPMEEVPYDAEQMMPLFAANPAYSLYSFVGYGAEDEIFFLPPYLAIYSTADFETFTDRTPEFPYGYSVQLEKLATLLENETELDPFTAIDLGGEDSQAVDLQLPFLPLFGAAQVFRAQPTYLEFEGGMGVRYLTYYSQAVDVIVNNRVFYTFQGVTDDGEYYISAIFPISSSVLPDEVAADLDYEAFSETYETYLEETVAALQAEDPANFTPSLETLDALITSLVIAGE